MTDNLGEKLRKAAEDGDLDEVKRCLAGEINIDYKKTALMWAAFKGHTRIVQTLLEAGIDPLLKEKSTDRTALDFARSNGHKDVILIIQNHIETTTPWKKTGNRQIRNASTLDGKKILMVQHFDFAASLCTTILTHPGGAVSHSCGGFQTMPPALIREAATELARQGGTPLPDRVTAGRTLVKKSPVI